MDETEQIKWATAATKASLLQLVNQHNLPLTENIKTKLDMVKLLVANNVSRTLKRSLSKPTTSSPSKRKTLSKVQTLVNKIKTSLDEPLAIQATQSKLQGYLHHDNYILKAGKIVGKVVSELDDGVLVNLEKSDVEVAVGERIPIDKLCVVLKSTVDDESNEVPLCELSESDEE